MKAILAAGAFALGALAPLSGAQPDERPRADLLVTNALVWTGDPERPRATTIAVRDGAFIHVGDDAAGLTARETVDARACRVLPGLIDTHVHLSGGALQLSRLDLRAATSREHLLSLVRRYAERLAHDDWVVGRGWSAESWPDQRPPTAEEIDTAAGGRKAVLIRMDGHSLIASASALEYADITPAGPPDPPGGKIGRAPGGRPDGAIYEEAMALVTRFLPGTEDARYRSLVQRAAREANAVGVTQIGAIEPRAAVERLLVPLDSDGDLSLRCAVTITSPADSIDEWRPILEWAATNPHPSARVRILGFKGYMDGSLGSRTAWQTEPYLDDPADPANAGMPLALAGSGALRDIILLAADKQLQPAVHAIGDRANNVLLDWFAEIPTDARRALRPRIEHAQHLLPEDIARFAMLGVVPSMQPLHKADDGRYAEQRLGPDRVQTSYAFRSLVDSGAALAFGSDWTVVSINPFEGIHAAVSAQTLDGRTFVPEQSITVEEALRAYTSAAAWCLHSEQQTGMIRPGLRADFIMLDRDILTVDAAEIPATRVLTTWLDGRLVHDAAQAPIDPAAP